MKKFIGTVLLAVLYLGASAQVIRETHLDSTGAYIMRSHGEMIEVFNDHQKQMIKNKTLVNGTTIHPNGVINVSSGQTKHLKNGYYITMDGHIRQLTKSMRLRNKSTS